MTHEPRWFHLPEKSRSIELYLSTVMAFFGLVLALPGDTLALSGYAQMRVPITLYFHSELIFGIALMWIGCGRGIAVIVNGFWYPNAIIRIVGCVIGSAFWMMLLVTFVTASDMRGFPGILAFVIPAFVYESFSATRCAKDAFEQDSFGLRGIRKCSTTRPM